MSKVSDKVALEPKPAESYGGVAPHTQSKGKATAIELEKPELSVKDVDRKFTSFMEEMYEMKANSVSVQVPGRADTWLSAAPGETQRRLNAFDSRNPRG